MKTSMATVSLGGSLSDRLESMARAGFAGVEIFDDDLATSGLSARQVADKVAACGLKITLFQPCRDVEGVPALLRARTFDRVERQFDTMEAMGADQLLLCSNTSVDASGDRGRIIDDICELGERAAKRGIRVGYEALSWGQHIYDYRTAWDIVQRVGMSNVGLILDTFHLFARKSPLGDIRHIPSDRIFTVQVADAPILDADYRYWSRHFRCIPGQGDFPLPAFMAALMGAGYDGCISLELFSDELSALPAVQVAQQAHEGLRHIIAAGAVLSRENIFERMEVF